MERYFDVSLTPQERAEALADALTVQQQAEQLKKAGCEERAELPFQRALLAGQLPYTIGGGIGQSRICMFFLRRAHIGEVQASIWPQETMDAARERGIELL